MKRHTSALKAKAQTHQVYEMFENAWKVISGNSNKPYSVSKMPDGTYTCNCDYGTCGGHYALRQSGCSHVAAVVAHEAAEQGRRISLHDGEEAAKRQHRPVVDLGQGLYLTTRSM